MIDPKVTERFWAKVKKDPAGCWLWTAAKNADGYGWLTFRRKSTRAHCVVWILTHGSIPVGMNVLHRCDVRSCVNPSHLFLGTQRENIADMDKKGRRVRARGVINGNALLTPEIVRAIRSDRRPRKQIASQYGVALATVEGVLCGRSWRHVA